MNFPVSLTSSSLLDQFRGAWIGAQVGAILTLAGENSSDRQLGQPTQPEIFRSRSDRFAVHSESIVLDQHSLDHHRLAFGYSLACAESLIRCGGVDRGDLHDRWQAVASSNPAGETSISNQLTQSQVGLEEILLPLMLYCHEDETALQQEIAAIGQALEQPLVPIRRCQLVGIALARLLRRRSHPSYLIQNLLEAGLPLDEATSALADLLVQVDHLVRQQSGLVAVFQACHGHPPALAPLMVSLYCVATAPYAPALAIGRTLWKDQSPAVQQPALSAVLAGMMSGLFNKPAGMPLHWQLALGSTLTEIRQASMALLASWSGVDAPEHLSAATLEMSLAVTAPGAMRPS